jgi:hypothetical protein
MPDDDEGDGGVPRGGINQLRAGTIPGIVSPRKPSAKHQPDNDLRYQHHNSGAGGVFHAVSTQH